MKIKALVSKETIVLVYDKQRVNVQKQQHPEMFRDLTAFIKAGDEESLIRKFKSIKDRIEEFTADTVTVENGVMILKADGNVVPQAIAEKLLDLEKNGQDFMPLLRFWKKLQKNPNKESIEELYDFMIKNKVPLTKQGDIVVEKGVNQKRQALPGELVDCRTGMVDNSVGMTVKMPRESVDSNRKNECSYGLHVGAPDYVRNHWSSDVVVECVVNPADVVSVPKDYNATKMRVCEYKVMGYSDKTRSHTEVVDLSDFIDSPSEVTQAEMNSKSKQSVGYNSQGVNTDKIKTSKTKIKTIEEVSESAQEIEGLTAKKVIEYVKDKTGKDITLSLKNKSGIVKKAIEFLDIHREIKSIESANNVEGKKLSVKKAPQIEKDSSSKQIDFSSMKKEEVAQWIKNNFNEDVLSSRRDATVKKAVKIAKSANYTTINRYGY